MSAEKTRREIIQYGKTGVLAGGLIGIAGCLGDDDDGDDGDDGAPGASDDELGDPVPEITYTSLSNDYDPIRAEMAQLIADQWRELGLEVEIESVSFQVMVDRTLVDTDHEITNVGWAGSPDNIDPDQFTYRVFHSEQTGEGQFNIYDYENEEYDALAEDQRRAMDREERQDIVHQCQEILLADQPLTPIANQQIIHPYNNERFSNPVPSLGEGLMGFWNFTEIEPASGVSTLILGFPDDTNKLNPLDTGAIHDRQIVKLMYDPLLRLGPDGEPVPWLATDWDVIDDTTIQLPLRTDVQWHDGEPLTAEDVKFSYEYQVEHSPQVSGYLDPVENVEILEDDLIEVTLEEPYAPVVTQTFGQVFIIPEHIWSDVPEGVDAEVATEWENPERIGSGPFTFDYWRREEEKRLVANPDHFAQPNIDDLLEIPFAGMTAATRSLRQEEIDVLGDTPPPDTVTELEDTDHISTAELEDHGFIKSGYRTSQAPYDDVAFRRALAYATPKQDIVEIVLDGRGSVAQSVIAEVNEFWHNPDIDTFTFDLEAAREELREAGYGWDDDGQLHYPP